MAGCPESEDCSGRVRVISGCRLTVAVEGFAETIRTGRGLIWIWISTLCSPALRPDRSRIARTVSGRAVSWSHTDCGARNVSVTSFGRLPLITSPGSCPTISTRTGVGYARTISGSAAVTAASHTASASSSAHRNVRIFRPKLLNIPLVLAREQIREQPGIPAAARLHGRRPEERHQDVFEPLRVDAAD